MDGCYIQVKIETTFGPGLYRQVGFKKKANLTGFKNHGET